MQIGVVGISHKVATLEERERFASLPRIPGCVVLSTCNRVEIYFSGDVPPCTLPHGYTLYGAACFAHLVSVVAGLDSLLFAETDIKRQVRVAYEEAGALSSELHYLFQKAFKLAKCVRLQCVFQPHDLLTDIVFKLVDAFLGENPSLLLIGFSTVNRRLMARWKRGRAVVVTRAGPGMGREELERVHLYDGVIAATKADGFLVSHMEAAMQTQLMIDLSLPRVIDPKLATQCRLLNLEQVSRLAAQLQGGQESALEKAKNFIYSAVEGYLERFSRLAVNTVFA